MPPTLNIGPQGPLVHIVLTPNMYSETGKLWSNSQGQYKVSIATVFLKKKDQNSKEFPLRNNVLFTGLKNFKSTMPSFLERPFV